LIASAVFLNRLNRIVARAQASESAPLRAWAAAASKDRRLEEAAELATSALSEQIEAFAIERRTRPAVLERAAERWLFRLLWHGDATLWKSLPPAQIALALAAEQDDVTWSWPVNLALRDVAMVLDQTKDPHAKLVARAFLDGTLTPLQSAEASATQALVESGIIQADEELKAALAHWDVHACVLLASAELEVREAQRRQIIALDAGAVHHEMLSGMRDLPKDRRLRKTPVRDGWAEILYPGKQLGLRLSVQDLPERIVHAVREWKHWQGLRHWAALQLLFTAAGRTGRIRWRLDDHLSALGYSDRSRRDSKVRAMVAAEVEALTRMELAIYHPDGTVRLRGPVLAVTQRAEAMQGSEWALEGLELVIHPVLYEGVRKASGEIGRLWAPAPMELARIDHIRQPHALALGLILPIRWRWSLSDEMDYVTLTGAKLLEAAGIDVRGRPGKAWTTLRQSMDALQRVGGLGRFEWEGAHPWALEGRCRLYQPQWARERMIHGIMPPETVAPPSILTGGEFTTWRKAKNWTQEQAAEMLGVSRWTILRAERATDEELKQSLLEALQKLR
jgi:hypothetical protein